MKNNRKISLANCDFNFQSKNNLNTNKVKTISKDFSGRLQREEQQKVKIISSDLKASIQTEKRQKVKTISSNLKGNIQLAKQTSGITLIALVVTIVVLLILAGVSISTVLGNNGIMPRANEVKFKTELANIQEEFNLYVMDKTGENGDFSVGSLNASANLLEYNTQPDEEKGTGNISTVLKSSTAQKYIQSKSFSIIKGDLIYASQNAKELEWAQEAGIAINPYNIDENGVLLSSDTNLMLKDEATGTLVIPEMVKVIGEGAFANVKGLKKIIIPSNVTEIKNNAFRGNTEIEEVIIQANEELGLGVTKIGYSVFFGCSKLTRIDLPNTVTFLGEGVFWNCTQLQEVTLSTKLKSIPTHSFVNNYKLKKIEIPEGIADIGNRAFIGSGLTEISIPASLTHISDGVFHGVTTIQNVNINENNNSFIYNNGILSTKNGEEMILVTNEAIKGNTFTIPEGVIRLTDGLIVGYNQITKIIIPRSLSSISTDGFTDRVNQFEIDENNPNFIIVDGGIYSKDKTTLYYYFANNLEVTIPEGTKIIGTRAIKRGKNFVFPDSLETINNYGIMYITSDNMKFGKNLKNINNMALHACNIKNIEISNENPNFIAEGCAIYNADKTKIILHVDCSATSFSIPRGIKVIEVNCFSYHNRLKEIDIPDTVQTIRDYAFASIPGITKIEIPSSVTSIGANVFGGSENLVEVIIDKEKGSIPGSPWSCMIGERAIKWLR